MASSGFVAAIDETLCTCCTICEEACMFGAIRVNGDVSLRWSACMGCGVCVGQCPAGALSLVRDMKKGLPLDLLTLAREELPRASA